MPDCHRSIWRWYWSHHSQMHPASWNKTHPGSLFVCLFLADNEIKRLTECPFSLSKIYPANMMWNLCFGCLYSPCRFVWNTGKFHRIVAALTIIFSGRKNWLFILGLILLYNFPPSLQRASEIINYVALFIFCCNEFM